MGATRKLCSSIMIYAIDVGSTIPGRNGIAFAWSGVDDDASEVCTGSCPEKLATEIATRISAGESVALGIEAPLYIPVPDNKAECIDTHVSTQDDDAF